MSSSPFVEDPRKQLRERIALAVDSPIDEVRAIHLRAAEHLAELAKINGLARNTTPPASRR